MGGKYKDTSGGLILILQLINNSEAKFISEAYCIISEARTINSEATSLNFLGNCEADSVHMRLFVWLIFNSATQKLFPKPFLFVQLLGVLKKKKKKKKKFPSPIFPPPPSPPPSPSL